MTPMIRIGIKDIITILGEMRFSFMRLMMTRFTILGDIFGGKNLGIGLIVYVLRSNIINGSFLLHIRLLGIQIRTIVIQLPIEQIIVNGFGNVLTNMALRLTSLGITMDIGFIPIPKECGKFVATSGLPEGLQAEIGSEDRRGSAFGG